jgi:hypothetical protein
LSHIKKFSKSVDSNYKIVNKVRSNENSYSKNTFLSRIQISNKEFVENLINQGCIPNKTHNLVWNFDQIPS